MLTGKVCQEELWRCPGIRETRQGRMDTLVHISASINRFASCNRLFWLVWERTESISLKWRVRVIGVRAPRAQHAHGLQMRSTLLTRTNS